MIAPDEWVSDTRSDDPKHRSPGLGAWLVSTHIMKRTERGHTEQSRTARLQGEANCCGAKKAIPFAKRTRRKRPLASALPRPAAERSGFVRRVRAVSVSQ